IITSHLFFSLSSSLTNSLSLILQALKLVSCNVHNTLPTMWEPTNTICFTIFFTIPWSPKIFFKIIIATPAAKVYVNTKQMTSFTT
ncbi:hypothetical protein L9F63_026498, partial [Diploptera punctata]